jgi:phenylalanyl-tRNA synthetase beta chain
MADAGMQEIITYSMTDTESLAKVLAREDLAVSPPLRLANPLSRQFEYARTTLRHALLQTLAANIRGTPDRVALFEIARVYLPQDDDLPREVETLCSVVCGGAPDRWGAPAGEPAGFYDAKAYVEFLLDALNVRGDYVEAHDIAYLPGRTAALCVGDQRIGIVGEVHPRVLAAFDIDAPAAMFEVDVEALLPHVPAAVHFRPISPYPPVEQDIALIVASDVSAGRVLKIIRSFPLVASARVFDVYTGDPIPAGRKSLAFAVSFQAPDRTLQDVDVAKQRGRIVERLKRDVGAELRG